MFLQAHSIKTRYFHRYFTLYDHSRTTAMVKAGLLHLRKSISAKKLFFNLNVSYLEISRIATLNFRINVWACNFITIFSLGYNFITILILLFTVALNCYITDLVTFSASSL